jgi:hypothetical protein
MLLLLLLLRLLLLSFRWAYNENSGDTGGIVMNQWQDMNWLKLRFMMSKLGLKPWYKGGSARRHHGAGDIVDEAGPEADTLAAAAGVPLVATAAGAVVPAAATAIEP